MKHIVITTLAATASVHAAISINLPGNSETSGWESFRNANPFWAANGYPTAFPNAGLAWPAPIAANTAGSQGSAVFKKESGNGYFAGSSLYDAGAPGTFSLSDNAPMLGISTVVFQIDAGTSIGVLPTLSYNGGSQALTASFFTQANGEYSTFNFTTGQSFPTQNRAWQWDLSGLGVTSYQINWGSAPNNHLTQYELNLTTGDTFFQVVPEPSSLVMLSLASLAAFRRRR